MEISYVLFVLSSANFIFYVCYYFCTVFYCQQNKQIQNKQHNVVGILL